MDKIELFIIMDKIELFIIVSVKLSEVTDATIFNFKI